MRCIEIERPGGPEVLRLVDRATPVPREREVLIRVAAAGVNRPECPAKQGKLSAAAGRIRHARP